MDIDDLDVAREEEVRPGDEGQVHGNPLPGENSNSDQFSKEITEKLKSKEFVIKLPASKKGLLSAVFGTVIDSSNQKELNFMACSRCFQVYKQSVSIMLLPAIKARV